MPAYNPSHKLQTQNQRNLREDTRARSDLHERLGELCDNAMEMKPAASSVETHPRKRVESLAAFLEVANEVVIHLFWRTKCHVPNYELLGRSSTPLPRTKSPKPEVQLRQYACALVPRPTLLRATRTIPHCLCREYNIAHTQVVK